jgi:Carboxypeptidase regulatory-like domain
MMSYGLALLFAVVVCVSLCAASAWAQTAGAGASTVTVADPNGAVIAGASVTVSNAAGLSRTGAATTSGRHAFTLLPAGVFKVSISASGFKALQAASYFNLMPVLTLSSFAGYTTIGGSVVEEEGAYAQFCES